MSFRALKLSKRAMESTSLLGAFCFTVSASNPFDVDSVALLESFRALKLTLLETFRALKLSKP